MPLFRQLELAFRQSTAEAADCPPGKTVVMEPALRHSNQEAETDARAPHPAPAGRDATFEAQAREMLKANGAARIADEIRVEWNRRLKTCAGRADYQRKLISLNPLLQAHGPTEIDRTFRHELAHVLAQFRAGRRRILPHGPEWRQACHDLAIGDEKRCHDLPFPVRQRARAYLYRCPNCRRDFPRTQRIRRSIACLACCQRHNGGKFDPRFKLTRIR